MNARSVGRPFLRSHTSSYIRDHTQGRSPISVRSVGRFSLGIHTSKHIRVLTQDRNPLSECGNCFCHSSGLRVHRQTHTGVENPIHAENIGEAFSQKLHPIMHQIAHAGESPVSRGSVGNLYPGVTGPHPSEGKQSTTGDCVGWKKTNLCNSSSHERNLMNTITMETISATIFTHRLSIIRKESSMNSLGRNLYPCATTSPQGQHEMVETKKLTEHEGCFSFRSLQQ